MCAGAIVLARIPTVVYGLSDPKRGGQSVFGILDHPGLIHRANVIPGVLEDICRERLSGVLSGEARGADRQAPRRRFRMLRALRLNKEVDLLTEPTAREYSAHIHGAMGTPVRAPFNYVMQQFRFSFFGFAWFFTDPGRRSAS